LVALLATEGIVVAARTIDRIIAREGLTRRGCVLSPLGLKIALSTRHNRTDRLSALRRPE